MTGGATKIEWSGKACVIRFHLSRNCKKQGSELCRDSGRRKCQGKALKRQQTHSVRNCKEAEKLGRGRRWEMRSQSHGPVKGSCRAHRPEMRAVDPILSEMGSL